MIDLHLQNVSITRLGLTISAPLKFEEWRSMATRLGSAVASMAFVVGDWLIYGEENFLQPALPGLEDTRAKRVSRENYDLALAETRMDRGTLAQYAYVARSVKPEHRNSRLSWEHHKAVAKLDAPEQVRWLKLACGDGLSRQSVISTRRFRKSIVAGRVLLPEELETPTDKGQANHIPFINRLIAWWDRLEAEGWLEQADDEQIQSLLRDFKPILEITGKLSDALGA